MNRLKLLTVAAFGCAVLFATLPPVLRVQGSASAGPVGLSLLFQNGQGRPATLTLVGDGPRYLQEVDIVASAKTTTDEGIRPLIESGEFSSLDWEGVRQVEEDWRLDFDGLTYVRQRGYRDARWMNQPGKFVVTPTDDAGNQVGEALVAQTGADDRAGSGDDGFTRRFVARQITRGCRAVGDCSGSTDFTAYALVQWRDALRPEVRARKIPAEATRLTLRWTVNESASYTVPVRHAAPSEFPYGYGLGISLEELSAPLNGSYYLPGEVLTYRVTFTDGAGRRLHPRGSLPTYGQFMRGEVRSGLRYLTIEDYPTLYYAQKHRQGDMQIAFAGPVDKLRTSQTVLTLEQALLPQHTQATVARDGYTSVVQILPPASVVFGGLYAPAVWETPVSDTFRFAIPLEAQPGTYLLVIKARREFGGEPQKQAKVVEVQVGQRERTTYEPKTGRCETCHTGPTDLKAILHGVETSDRRACIACHGPLYFEPDAPLDIRVHTVHDRSRRFAGDMQNCATCHLAPPDGPARGLLGP